MQSKESRLHCMLFYNLMHYHTSLDGYYYSHAVRRNTMNDNNRIIWIVSIKNIFLIKPFLCLDMSGFPCAFHMDTAFRIISWSPLTFWYTKNFNTHWFKKIIYNPYDIFLIYIQYFYSCQTIITCYKDYVFDILIKSILTCWISSFTIPF